MDDNLIVELVWALAVLAFPICLLLIAIIFKKDISLLLDRIGCNKLQPKEEIDAGETAVFYQGKETKYTVEFEVCKNISTGKYFIVLSEINDNESLMIIPTGEILPLRFELFDESEITDIFELYKNNLLTDKQLEKLFTYIATQSEEYIDNYTSPPITGRPTIPTEDEPPTEVEPVYISNYRNMLRNPDTLPSRMLECIRNEHTISWVNLKNILRENYGYSETAGGTSASLRVLLIDGYVKIYGRGDDKIIKSSGVSANELDGGSD